MITRNQIIRYDQDLWHLTYDGRHNSLLIVFESPSTGNNESLKIFDCTRNQLSKLKDAVNAMYDELYGARPTQK